MRIAQMHLMRRFVNSKLNFSLDKYDNKYRNGFTLTELLIVISIIGILATTSVVGLRSARNKAKIGKAKSEMRLYGMAVKEFNSRKLFSTEKWPVEASGDCDSGSPYTVPTDLQGLWKEGTTIPYCYYTKNWITDGGTEVGIIWQGLKNSPSDTYLDNANSLGNLITKENYLLIIQNPVSNDPASDAYTRSSTLKNASVHNVIYMDK